MKPKQYKSKEAIAISKLEAINRKIVEKKAEMARMTRILRDERARFKAQGIFLQEVKEFEKARNIIHKAGEVIGHFIRILDQASDEALLKSVQHIQSRFSK